MSWAFTVIDYGDGTGGLLEGHITSGTNYDVEFAVVSATSVGAWTFCEGGTSDISGLAQIILSALNLPSATGSYLIRVKDQFDVVQSSVMLAHLTVEGDSIHARCVDMIADRIDALDLTGMPADGVIKRLGGSTSNIAFPCVLLTLPGEAENNLGGPINTDHYGVQIGIWAIDRVPWESDTLIRRLLNWRQKIYLALHQQRWDLRVPEVWLCRYRPGVVIDPRQQIPDHRASMGVVECVLRQGRGLS